MLLFYLRRNTICPRRKYTLINPFFQLLVPTKQVPVEQLVIQGIVNIMQFFFLIFGSLPPQSAGTHLYGKQVYRL